MDDIPILTDAVRAIASGEAVNWDLLESAVDERSSGEFRALKRVSEIASFHRDLHRMAAANTEPVDAALPVWRSLRIVEEIGRGAYSRVYRAKDPRLDRDVALKILNAAVPSNSELALTVLDEGRHLARLRHPNVVAIHGAGSVDGWVGLEMELILGKTFHDIVREQGPLGADEALLVGRDVCRALAAVHRAGLVHRDVKAHNVMRESGGRVVLMDLGAGQPTNSLHTQAIAGTPLYLAPEVLSGSPATPRSDVYSLGVLLFYLVTGTYPIMGQSLTELGEAHRTQGIARLRDLRPELPERFIRIVERALAARPEDRFDGAGTFEASLSEALSLRHGLPTPATPRRLLIGLFGAIVAGTVAWALWPGAAPSDSVGRFAIPLNTWLTRPSPPGAMEFAISQDGRRIVYSESAMGTGARIYQRRLDEVQPTLVRELDSGQPFLSPDGQWVGLHRQAEGLVKVALDGNALVSLIDWPSPGGGAWDHDGTIVLSSEGDLWRVADSGGARTRLTTMNRAGGEAAIRPAILPNGTILFTLRTSPDTDRIAALDRAGHIRPVVSDGKNAKYLPPGYLVFVRGDWLMAARFDAARAELLGDAVQIQRAGSGGWFDLSSTGSLITGSIESRPGDQARLAWIDRTSGRETPLPFPEFTLTNLLGIGLLSPDGRRVAVMKHAETVPETNPLDNPTPGILLIGDLSRGTMTPLTTDSARLIAWTPDGTRVTYLNSRRSLASKRADGSDAEQELPGPPSSRYSLSRCSTGVWSPKEDVLLMACAGGKLNDLVALTVSRIHRSRGASEGFKPFLDESYGEAAPVFSPDGSYVAYVSTESGVREVYARAYPNGFDKVQISIAGGQAPRWVGSEIFYFDYNTRKPMVVAVQSRPQLRAGQPKPAVERVSTIVDGGFQVSPDGRKLLVLRGSNPLTPNQLDVVLNWTQVVERRLAIAR